MKTTEIPIMLSIKNASKLSGMSEFSMRQLCTTKKIQFVKSGNKYLINSQKLSEYLNGGTENEGK